MARKNSVPTMRHTAGNASLRIPTRPDTTLFLYTANLRRLGFPSGPTRPSGAGSLGSSSAAANSRCLSVSCCMTHLAQLAGEHDRFGAFSFRLERRPSGEVGVPLDEGGDWADTFDRMLEEAPDDLVDRAIMGVNQERPPLFIGLSRIAGEMDFVHMS